MLFTLSAISATVVDHWIGNLDRSNLRWFYIVVGVAGMAGSAMLQHVVNEQVPMREGTSGFLRQDRCSAAIFFTPDGTLLKAKHSDISFGPCSC
ncbi:hypothetical protein [Haloferula chungangensis]|uniref:hypothetical protein n=1 Tax=Haloferula chungangensis TaxID=1048331 RepID=UPI0036D2E2B4